MADLTFSMENYLEAVYELSASGEGARITDIACRMNVTKASANNAMTVLAEKGLITNEKYQLIRLTPLGQEFARIISQKHRIIQTYLTNVLNIDEATADVDACAIEHVISHDSVYAMYQALAQSGIFNFEITDKQQLQTKRIEP